MNLIKFQKIIGIDTGKNTGLAILDTKSNKWDVLKSYSIHTAMKIVEQYAQKYNCYIMVEDARLRKWKLSRDMRRLQGVGYVKAHAAIWEDFLDDLKKEIDTELEFVLKAPRNTKVSTDKFRILSGYDGLTNNHVRDAGMMVLNLRKHKR